MREKATFENKRQAKLDAWSAEVDKLEAGADEVEADRQLEYEHKRK